MITVAIIVALFAYGGWFLWTASRPGACYVGTPLPKHIILMRLTTEKIKDINLALAKLAPVARQVAESIRAFHAQLAKALQKGDTDVRPE